MSHYDDHDDRDPSGRRQPRLGAGWQPDEAGGEAPLPPDPSPRWQRRAYAPGPGESEDEVPGQRRNGLARRRLLLPLGGAGLLLLFVLVAWYAYVSGAQSGAGGPVPLVQADATSFKMRPEQPGGMEIPHQDKLVFGRLNPGSEDEPIERLLPGPEQPLPRPEPPADLLAREVAPVPAEPGPVSAPPVPAPPVSAPGELPAGPAYPAIAAGEPPPAPVARVPEPVPAPAPSAPAPVESPAAQAAAVPPAAARPEASEKRVRLQIASVRSEEVARQEFQRLQRRFPDELGGLGLSVERADLGDRGIFFRVHAGPVEEARAGSICQALKAQSVGCLIIR